MFTELTSKPVPGTLAPIFRRALIWLDTDDEHVRREALGVVVGEGVCGEEWNWMATSVAFLKPLAGPDVERDPRPPPVIHEHFERDEGLGHGPGVDVLLLAVAGDLFTPQPLSYCPRTA